MLSVFAIAYMALATLTPTHGFVNSLIGGLERMVCLYQKGVERYATALWMEIVHPVYIGEIHERKYMGSVGISSTDYGNQPSRSLAMIN
jgi:hypothetical protein